MGSTFRKGSAQTGQSAGSSSALDAMSAQILRQGAKLRDPAFEQLAGFLNTGQIPAALTGSIGTQEQELATAKRGIEESGARGGQLRTALAQLPLERLGMRDKLRSGIFDTALNVGMGSAQSGIAGMGQAAANLNSLGAQRIQQNQMFQQGLGNAVGKGVGSALGKPGCWIAARFYGWADPRTRRIRAWFFYHRPSWWLTRCYARHGAWASQQPWIWTVKPVFDLIGGR